MLHCTGSTSRARGCKLHWTRRTCCAGVVHVALYEEYKLRQGVQVALNEEDMLQQSSTCCTIRGGQL
jgi:hypothetical protein